MYGTIAKARVKAGKAEELSKLMGDRAGKIPGIVFELMHQCDHDPQEVYLVVGFESKDAYQTNAASPEQHAEYLQYRALLESDPEWHDGTIIQSRFS